MDTRRFRNHQSQVMARVRWFGWVMLMMLCWCRPHGRDCRRGFRSSNALGDGQNRCACVRVERVCRSRGLGALLYASAQPAIQGGRFILPPVLMLKHVLISVAWNGIFRRGLAVSGLR